MLVSLLSLCRKVEVDVLQVKQVKAMVKASAGRATSLVGLCLQSLKKFQQVQLLLLPRLCICICMTKHDHVGNCWAKSNHTLLATLML